MPIKVGDVIEFQIGRNPQLGIVTCVYSSESDYYCRIRFVSDWDDTHLYWDCRKELIKDGYI